MANQVLTHEITTPNCNCTYNQIIRVDSLQVNPPQPLTFLLCEDEIPYEFDGLTSFITFGFEEPIEYKLSQTTQVNGCDSFIVYNAYVFEIIDGMINEIECDPIEGVSLFVLVISLPNLKIGVWVQYGRLHGTIQIIIS